MCRHLFYLYYLINAVKIFSLIPSHPHNTRHNCGIWSMAYNADNIGTAYLINFGPLVQPDHGEHGHWLDCLQELRRFLVAGLNDGSVDLGVHVQDHCIHLSIQISIPLSIYFIYFYISLSIYQSTYISIYLSIYLSFYLFIYLSIYYELTLNATWALKRLRLCKKG